MMVKLSCKSLVAFVLSVGDMQNVLLWKFTSNPDYFYLAMKGCLTEIKNIHLADL